MKWTTKDGTELDVFDMTEDHARNAVNMLLRTKNPNTLLYLILKGREAIEDAIANERKRMEVYPQGEIAQMLNDSHENDDLWEDCGDEPWLWP